MIDSRHSRMLGPDVRLHPCRAQDQKRRLTTPMATRVFMPQPSQPKLELVFSHRIQTFCRQNCRNEGCR
jgi:hypothetical protein